MRCVVQSLARRGFPAFLVVCLASNALGQAGDEPLRASFGKAITAELLAPSPPVQRPAPNAVPHRTEGTLYYPLQLTMPDASRLFTLEAEDDFRERMRQEARHRGVRQPLEFPDSKAAPHIRDTPRRWLDHNMTVEPSYVISGRLFWEQPAFERYGKSLGVLQPGVSTGIFLFDTLIWPVRRVTPPWSCNQLYTDSYSPYFNLIGQGRP